MTFVLNKENPLETKIKNKAGHKMRILAVDVKNSYPIAVAVVCDNTNKERIGMFTLDGKISIGKNTDFDLINVEDILENNEERDLNAKPDLDLSFLENDKVDWSKPVGIFTPDGDFFCKALLIDIDKKDSNMPVRLKADFNGNNPFPPDAWATKTGEIKTSSSYLMFIVKNIESNEPLKKIDPVEEFAKQIAAIVMRTVK